MGSKRAGSALWAAAVLTSAIALVAPPANAGYLYFADIFYPSFSDGSIKRMDTTTHVVETVEAVGGGLRGIALDAVNQKLYWTDVTRQVIGRSALDGSGAASIITTGLSWPMDIDAHPAADRIAWGDQTLSQIGIAHLDGSGAAPLLSTPFASGIAFDTVNGKIYWSTAVTDVLGEIRRANLDGSNQQVVIADYGRPASIALDVSGGKIYWTDYVNDVVRRANLDGTGRQTLYVVGANLNPDGIALNLTERKVYWAQSYQNDRDKIMRMNLDGTSPEDVLVDDFGLISDLAFLGGASDAPSLDVAAGPVLTCWPNPLRDSATIRLALPSAVSARLGVFTADGRRIATLLDGGVIRGRADISWKGMDDRGRPVPGGIYFYRLDAGGRTWTSKAIVTR
jgi:sugar lactone lactonase YvrE